MRKFLIAAAALAAFSTSALAADQNPPMPFKAPPSPFLTAAGSGFYVGVGTSAAVASANISGNVFSLPSGITGGNTYAAGGTLDSDFGYIWGHCVLNTWCQFEADVKYQSIIGNTAVGSISSRWALTQEIDFGVDILGTIAKIAPGLNNPFPTFSPTGVLPANLAVAASPRGYFGFKQEEALVSGNVGAAGGQTWDYLPGVTGGWRWQTLGSNGNPNGGSIKAFADVLWATRGATIANLFGVGGAPIVTQANASMKNIYVAGLNWDFSPFGF